MLVPKFLIYYPQMWGYHPFKSSFLPANNKATLDKTKKSISWSGRLSFIICRLHDERRYHIAEQINRLVSIL